MKSRILRESSKAIAIVAMLTLTTMGTVSNAQALEEVGSDSRIRTLVYGKNDVFRITTSTGYQTVIQFEEEEKIKTISMGDSGSFKITPQKNRMFVKALIGGQLTNMTVITTKRHYQIELSSIIDSLDEMMYVVKFYYPSTFEDNNPAPNTFNGGKANYSVNVPKVSLQQQQPPMQPFIPGTPYGSGGGMMMPPMGGRFSGAPSITPPPQASGFPAQNQQSGDMNYNYTLTGPNRYSPQEVFDDGIRTYFKFTTDIARYDPSFRLVDPQGNEVPVAIQIQNGYYVVEGIAPKITVYFGEENICVYNEAVNSSYL